MIRRSTRALYLAGLGVVTSARRQGQAVFTRLVTEGRRVERRERALLSGRVDRLRHRADDLGAAVGARLESGCGALLRRAGVPTRQEVAELVSRLAELDARLKRLG